MVLTLTLMQNATTGGFGNQECSYCPNGAIRMRIDTDSARNPFI
jgi:hypothetical protein